MNTTLKTNCREVKQAYNKGKFKTIVEGMLNRYQHGSFLTGDLVTFKKSINNDPWVKDLGSNTREKLDQYISGDLNIRVYAVHTDRPAVQGSYQQDQQVGEVWCDIAREVVPMRYQDFMKVPARLLELIDTGINLPPIAKSQRREEKIHYKGEPAPDSGNNGDPFDAFAQTQTTPTSKSKDRKTASKNTKIKGTAAKDNRDEKSVFYGESTIFDHESDWDKMATLTESVITERQ